MTTPNLDSLFNPESIAMIGASASPLKWGFIILLNILKGAYSGKVYPVNPKAESILGQKCYPRVADVPENVDLVIITTPAKVELFPVAQEVSRKKPIIVFKGGRTDTGKGGPRFVADV